MQDAQTISGLESLPDVGNLLAKFGRYEDAYIAHLAEGETVVPMEVLDSNPALKEMLFNQMREMGIEPERYIVGNELNSINPVTGQPEFFLKKLWQGVKKVLKVAAPVIGAIAGSFIPIPVVGPMIGSFLASKLAGYSTKNALLGAAASGIGAFALGGTAAAQAGGYLGFSGGLGGPSLGSALVKGVGSQGIGSLFSAAAPAATQMPTAAAAPAASSSAFAGTASPWTAALQPAAPGAVEAAAAAPAATTGFTLPKIVKPIADYALKNPGLVLAGGAALASMLDKPEKIKPTLTDTTTGYDVYSKDPSKYQIANLGPAPVSYGGGESNYVNNSFYTPVPVNPIQPIDYSSSFAQFPVQPMVMAKHGGHIKGPGTGTSDSIPALLSDGEFVMTAKAVKGAGGGDRKAGARKMYQLMRQFEALHA